MARRKRGRRATQLHLDQLRWGGRRDGAGRPKTSRFVAHAARPDVSKGHPVHVTLRLCKGMPSLRSKKLYPVVLDALRRVNERLGLRVVEHSVQQDHLHLIGEVEGKSALSRGMQGLSIRLAKAINKAIGRAKGRVFRDRFHVEVLKTPRQVRHALAYVLNNFRKHMAQLGFEQEPRSQVDDRSSGPWFLGWRGRIDNPGTDPPPHAPPKSWLLRVGWRRHGLLDPAYVPSAAAS